MLQPGLSSNETEITGLRAFTLSRLHAFALVFLYFFPGLILQAKEEEYTAIETFSTLTSGSQLTKSVGSVSGDDLYAEQVRNAVIFSVDHDKAFESGLSAFEATVTFTVTSNGSTAGASQRLALSYNPARGKQSADRSIYRFSEGKEVTVTVQSLEITGNTDSESSVRAALRLENRIFAERMYKLTGVPQMPGEEFVPLENNEYEITWSDLDNVEGYQLEWLHVNDYEGAVLPYDFANNATRVTTAKNTCRISGVFEQGWVLLRVRAITYRDLEKKHMVTGAWSCGNSCSGADPSGYTGGRFRILEAGENIAATGYAHSNDSQNWQYTVNYAEEGRKKEVVTYSDGTYRSRQAVTRINSEGNVIVGETFYDRQGRPAVQALPAPASGETEKSTLKYHRNFNLNDGNQTYSRADFDPQPAEEEGAACNPEVPAMNSSNGAARYYSPQNEDAENGFNRFIPDAEGYPFSHTQYEPDNTGRIRRQGGVGRIYQTGSGHETKYSYLIPAQQELDRLFGSEIGENTHYRKNVVRDANGQFSVSYVDLQGRVRATALAGKAPDGMEQLTSYEPETTTISIIDRQAISSEMTSLTSQHPYLVTSEEDDHVFRYTLQGIRFNPSQALPEGVCMNCIYHLTLDITDECGDRPEGFEPIEMEIGTLENLCDPTSGSTGIDFTIGRGKLKAGTTYQLTRILSIDRGALAAQTQIYLEQTGKRLSDFIREELSQVSWDDCVILTCEEQCHAAWGGDRAKVDSCIFDCDFPNPCEPLEEIMISDYRPGMRVEELGSEVDLSGTNEKDHTAGGQYALYRIDESGNYVSADAASVFHNDFKERVTNILGDNFVDSHGNRINEADEADYVRLFVENFKPEWATILSGELHPEKCRLEQCRQETYQQSLRYDNLMLRTDSYEEALEKGLLNPLGMVENNIPAPTQLLDPCFLAKGVNSADDLVTGFRKTIMQATMTNSRIKLAEGESLQLTMWQKAAVMAGACSGGMTVEQCENHYAGYRFDALTEENSCNRDRIWQFFRSLYLAEKTKIVETYRNIPHSTCDNSHIGNGDEEPYGKKTRRFLTQDDYTGQSGMNELGDMEENPEAYRENAREKIRLNCSKSAESVADRCMDALAGCQALAVDTDNNAIAWDATDNTYNTLRLAFVQIMANSCAYSLIEEQSAYPSVQGFSSIPENVPAEYQTPYHSFEEAMTAILHIEASRMDELCSPDLISFPRPYGYVNENTMDTRLMDECACNRLLEREAGYNATVIHPPGVTSARRHFEYWEGLRVPDYSGKMCLCRQALALSNAAVWHPGMTWSEESRKLLLQSGEYIPEDLSCESCIDCGQMASEISLMAQIEWYKNYFERLGAEMHDELASALQRMGYNMERMVANRLNSRFNRNYSYYEYQEFIRNCQALEKGTVVAVCRDLTAQAEHLNDFLKKLALNHPPSERVCLTEDLHAIWAKVHPFEGDCRDFIYEPQQTPDSNELSIRIYSPSRPGWDCRLRLNFMDPAAGYDFGEIFSFENISIDMDHTPSDNGRFLIRARLAHGGREITVPLSGSTDCLQVANCYTPYEKSAYMLCPEQKKSITPDCEEILRNQAISNAKTLYDSYIEEETQRLRTLYLQQCIASVEEEEYRMTYTSGEHHYTLYYYDQAGNLVRTIPPQGVEFVPEEQFAQIADDRKNGTQTVFTRHRMETRYLYNSLNQLVAQYMPDHDPFENIRKPGASGLSAGLDITAAEIGAGGNGVLFGAMPENPARSTGYITADGGQTWRPITGLGIRNLNAVCTIGSSHIYAVGDNGTMLKSENGGAGWETVNTGTQDNLVAIRMHDTQTGYLFARNGNVYKTGDGVVWNLLPDAGLKVSLLEAVRFEDSNTGYAVGYTAEGGMVYSTEDGGESWTKEKITTGELMQVQLIDNLLGYACDVNGQLIKTDDGGRHWLPVPATGRHRWKELRFDATGNRAMAIDLSEALWSSPDGGHSWHAVSAGPAVKSIAGNNTGQLYALDAQGTLYTPDGGVASTLKDLAPGEQFNALYFENNARGYAAGDNGVLYMTALGTLGWEEIATGLSESITCLHAHTQAELNTTTLTAVTAGGALYEASFTEENALAIPAALTFTRNTAVTDPVAQLAWDASGNKYLLTASGSILTRTAGGGSWTQQSGTMSGIRSIAVSPQNPATGIAVGEAGAIRLTANAFADLQSEGEIRSFALHAVDGHAGTLAAAGDKGTILRRISGSPSRWEIFPAAFAQDLRTLSLAGTNHVIAGDLSGVMYENTGFGNPIAGWITYPLSETAGTLRGADYEHGTGAGGVLYAVRGDGSIQRREGGSVYTMQAGDRSLNAVVSDGAGSAWAVGDGGAIIKVTAGGVTPAGNTIRPSRVTSVTGTPGGKYYAVTVDGSIGQSADGDVWDFPSTSHTSGGRLNAVRFFDEETGVAVGDGIVLRTADGGNNWTVIAGTPATATLNDVSFSDSDNAVIVGNNGTVLTLNGNNSPVERPSGVSSINLNGVSFEGSTGFAAGDGGTLLRSENAGVSWELLTAAGGMDWASYTNAPTFQSASLNSITALDRRTAYAVGERGTVLHTADGGETWTRRESLTTERLRGMTLGSDRTVVMYGANGTLRSISNDSTRFSARFYYDRQGRLVASQNSRQQAMTPPRYSYTSYDAQGRIREAGEIAPRREREPDDELLNHAIFPDNWSDTRFEVVRTQYDTPQEELPQELNSLFEGGRQQHLRNRVATVAYYEAYPPGTTGYSHATHYSYDIHGNVKELVQDNPKLKNVEQQYKKVVYEYDLISGNVNMVSYQPGAEDRFYHKYEYDADNRIQSVSTSLDGMIWDHDANYQYYRHGPLARVELGDLKVQGIDYAYTLQGWIKAVNGFSDMGGGGISNDFSQDAFAYSLHYNVNDYKAINSVTGFLDKVISSGFAAIGNGATEPTAGADLYNGNIGKMVTAINGLDLQGKTYRYDQLNRLVASETYEGENLARTAANRYDTRYEYDANGNIQRLSRYGDNGLMDELAYNYAKYVKSGKEHILNNRLLHVNDAVTEESRYLTDMDDQGSYAQNDPQKQNYAYDKIGNLIKDEQEEIAGIKWNVQGKVTQIKRTQNSSRSDLLFSYDAMGNRISKTEIYPAAIEGVKEFTTYYVRDAQGNVMATYEKKREEQGRSAYAETISLTEQHIYGSRRLGMRQQQLPLYRRFNAPPNSSLAQPVAPIDVNYSSRVLGQKKFELTNHLGNVLAVVSDKKLADNEPDVKAVYDYYPFGMMMPNRSLSGDYRFGFNGKENINEISGTGNNLDFEGRMFDSRIIRTPSLDPNSIKYPALSPYSFLANNPINVVDYNGKDAVYIAFPSYKADGYPFTGHAGVLLIDNKTGLTKYYEYGRYDKAELGIVRHYAIPDVIIGADGRPTAESLNKVLQTISNKSGKGQEIEGAYIESDKFKEMNDYAQSKLKENTDTQREPYSITGNNCGTFAADVINQDESLNTPTILDPRPVSIIDEYQDNFTPLDYDPKQGTTIEYNEKTVSYDKSSKKTIVSQSWFQKLVNGDKTNTGAQTE